MHAWESWWNWIVYRRVCAYMPLSLFSPVCVCLCVSYMTNSIRFNLMWYGVSVLFGYFFDIISLARIYHFIVCCIYCGFVQPLLYFFVGLFFFWMSFFSWRFHRTCLFTLLFYFFFFCFRPLMILVNGWTYSKFYLFSFIYTHTIQCILYR